MSETVVPTIVRVLTGSAGGSTRGAEVTFAVVGPKAALEEPRASEVDVVAGSVFRAFPLLALTGPPAGRLLAVGQVRLFAEPGQLPHLRLLVRALWTSKGDRSWKVADESEVTSDVLAEALAMWARGIGHGVPVGWRHAAETLAKGLAETSRDGLKQISRVRNELELRLAEQLDPKSEEPLEPVLADAIQLLLALGRAGDEARAADREGLWAWRTEEGKAAYHAMRHRRDPTLTKRTGHTAALKAPWFTTYDLAVRQCQGLEREAVADAPLLERLLGYGSTIANARDAQGQEAFNLVAAIATVALGIPALVLSLYGATTVLPLRLDAAGLHIILPLVLGGLVAVSLAWFLPGRKKQERLRYATVGVALLVGLLLLAGGFFVKARVDPLPQPAGTSTPAP